MAYNPLTGNYEDVGAHGGWLLVEPQVPASWESLRVDVATIGYNEIVPAVGGYRIYVVGLTLVSHGNVDVTVAGAVVLPARTGMMSFPADGDGFVWPIAGRGWYCRTAASEALTITLNAAVRVAGIVTYYTA